MMKALSMYDLIINYLNIKCTILQLITSTVINVDQINISWNNKTRMKM